YQPARHHDRRLGIAEAVAAAACQLSHDLRAKAIVVITRSGRTAQLVSKNRPAEPIVALTEDEGVARSLCLWWGVQPVVTAFREGREETTPFPSPATIAAGLRVPAPKGGFLVLRALRETGGAAVEVTDASMLDTMARLRRAEGLDVCPEGAAAVAALADLVARGLLDGCREVVVVNTGSGLKHPELSRPPAS
ncbi:MAG: pyridoxal-phosphate dependent enzyme, partial [Firmicutes bacterium]|nr:pyridoxal-phosphate dependent enzyme [Bacillota bacterium]